jgi:glycosyltransferase involved in cell wall biosynthesis
MSTYNGRPWVTEQIESLAKQTRPPIELIVTDDNSTDGTVDTIRALGPKLPFPLRIRQNAVRLGYAENFLSAAELAEAPYICWCDQDDVWLPAKLDTMAKLIEANPKASLFVHQSTLVDQALNTLGANHPVIRQSRYEPPLTGNPLARPPGFAMTFGRDLMTRYDWKSRPADFEFAGERSKHDTSTYTIANAVGGVYFTTEVLALYRRHQSNASYFRPGTNASRRLKQWMSAAQAPAREHLETQERAFREHAAYFEACARKAEGPADRERFAQLAQKYRRGEDLAQSRLAIHHSSYGRGTVALGQALSKRLYVDGKRLNRRILFQDCMALIPFRRF